MGKRRDLANGRRTVESPTRKAPQSACQKIIPLCVEDGAGSRMNHCVECNSMDVARTDPMNISIHVTISVYLLLHPANVLPNLLCTFSHIIGKAHSVTICLRYPMPQNSTTK